ncbi:FHA domain-containing protein PS1 [Daucus carota subsp. sativus]|uniref:FHA domain-containing protein PS1 n=1 Tax=Daucus carota subsp. sativus TaxID=79200 RepID=UPI0030836C68
MGDQKKEEEKKVPVFTVLKKNSILKNIFLDAPQTNQPTANQEDEEEQVIVIGRHTDCSITLDHPSISRFHLRLHSNPSSLKLSLVDLSSVHGTWVSGKKVEPGVKVDLNEGDIVQLGGSSRRYILHWVPVSRAYNLDVPFVPPMDVLMSVKETENLSNQDENCCPSTETNQIQSQGTSMGKLDLSISKNEIGVSTLSPAMPEFGDFSCDNAEAKKGNLPNEEQKQNEISGIFSGQPLKEESIEEIKSQHSGEVRENLPDVSSPINDHNKDLFREEHEENEVFVLSSGTPFNDSAVTKFEDQQFDEEHQKNEIAGIFSATPLKESAVTKCENQQSDEENDEKYEENEISGFSSGTPLKELAVTQFENQQSDEENDEHLQALAGILSGISSAKSPSGDYNKISAFSSGQLLNDSVLEIVNQQYGEEHENLLALDGAISGMANVNSLNQQCGGKHENSQALDGAISDIVNLNRPIIDHNEHLLKEEHQISDLSSGQLFNESVLEIGSQQYDEVCENSQSCLSGIENADSSLTIYHNEHPLRGESEDNEVSGFSSGQFLNESVIEITSLQSDGEDEESPLNGVLSGIANEKGSPDINNYEHRILREEFDEHETSAFSCGQLFNESVLEIDHQQYDEVVKKSQALDGVPSGAEDANSSSTIYHNELSVSSSGQLHNDSVLETKYLHCDGVDEKPPALDGYLSGIADANRSPTIYHNEHQLKEDFQKNEISGFTSVQLLDESVVEIGIQQYYEDHEKSQAVDGVPHSLCKNYHNKNLPEFFTSSFSEDVEIICASRTENEQEKMSTSGCYSPCSSTVLERKDQLYLYEQDHSTQYHLNSEVHAVQSLKNNPSKSEQESNWPEIIRDSLSDAYAVISDSSEALDNESSLNGDNKQKEVTVVTGTPKIDLMNLSVCGESIHTEVCFEQLDEKTETGITFATNNVSEPKDANVNTPLRSEEQIGEWFPTNTEVKELYNENLDYESVPEELISNIEVFAEEIFTPDKENFTPNTPIQRSTKKTDKLEDFKLLDPLCLSSPTMNSICRNFVQNEELTFSSDKENHTPKVLQKSRLVQPASRNSARLNVEPATKNRMSRIPFKSLLSNSSGKSCSNDTTSKSSNSGKYAQLIEKNTVAGDNKRWIMVADTDCLLNKVSRKALQLLQGVKGTRLIIPRVVIRELDCMKRRGYLFTKAREISSALQWIEDCMKNTNWWIHIESLMEEGRHLTPALSLSTTEIEMEDLTFSSASFSASLSLLEIVSPTPGDHILECALLNRGMKNGENLVILSDDVSLKIKAMAEGIICEAAEEFRDSLVNPFSDRFLWAKSSPRGLTWSCIDDIVLREKYYRGPFKKPPSKSGESLKGLKLILVQNSHFSGLIPN